MKWYKLLLTYRPYIAIGLLVLSVILALTDQWDWFYLALILGLVALLSQVLFGPMRLIQDAIEEGDVDQANKLMNSVYVPQLLIKPVREGFYMLKSNLAMMNKDFDAAESFAKKSMKSKSKLTGAGNEGAASLQLGMISMQSGNLREAKKHLKQAISKGISDKEGLAAAYLQLAAIDIQFRQIKTGRAYFKKAKALNPKSPEVKSQIKQMDKYIHRM